jgi:hypothetical protein
MNSTLRGFPPLSETFQATVLYTVRGSSHYFHQN